MSKLIKTNNDYKAWVTEIKQHIRQSQFKAAVKVNTELIRLYWTLGKDIVERQSESEWGKGFFNELSQDLKDAFPDMEGFSVTNLKYMKRMYLFYSQSDIIRQQLADELQEHLLFSIPWWHHVVLMTKCNTIEEALFYMKKIVENGWSRNVLMNFIEADLYKAEGKAITNFASCLPNPQSDLAQQTLKDPYNFDFLSMRSGYRERELEDALTENITKFLLELGNGFAYIGRQVRLEIGAEEYFIDLLFYNYKLRCFIVTELKTGKFKVEYVSKLGLYVSAVNHQMRHKDDNPTIGLLICKTKDEVVAKYTLESINQPIGISEYQLAELLPKDFRSSLPSIEEIENELKDK
ncbi:PDDEXK nuclease domain-containing protein [Parabacteroides segnis]|uniref:PDDEXK nuclease domain-containing protein n=1 Tax=Parabacteroides segnis TaxID=2763058 RepID=UPI00351654AC